MARKKIKKKKTYFLVCFLLLVGICYAGVKLLSLIQRYYFVQETIKHPEEFTVTSKDNSQNNEDFFIENNKTKKRILWVTLSSSWDEKSRSYSAGCFSGCYSNARYRNGNLYLRRQISVAGNGKNSRLWDLWVYDWRKKGRKLYSPDEGFDFDFEVTDNEKIAILLIDKLVLLNKRGAEILTFPVKELTVAPWIFSDPRQSDPYEPWIKFINVSSNSIWLENFVTTSTGGLVKLDINTYTVEKYDISDLGILGDFDFNVKKEKIASSGCPLLAFVTEEDRDSYKQSKTKEELVVYDLATKTKELVATSIIKCFHPRWINENTLEYDDPNGQGRKIKKLD